MDSSTNQIATTSLMNSPFMRAFNAIQPVMSKFSQFMDQYVISPKDLKSSPNFICVDPEESSRYLVPDDSISEMMQLLNDCFGQSIPNYILECQFMNDQEASGLFFDFVFETPTGVVPFDNVVLQFSQYLFIILTHYLDFDPSGQDYIVFHTASHNPVHPTQKNQYRSKFRITIPGIQLDRNTRFFIYQRVWNSKTIKTLFDTRLNYSLRSCLQMSSQMPASLLGSFVYPDENDPMTLNQVIGMNVCLSDSEWQHNPSVVSNASNDYKNLPAEMLLGYTCVGTKISKRHYPIRQISKRHLSCSSR